MLGDHGVGKSTFLNSLSPNSASASSIYTEVQVRDIKNNLLLTFQFLKIQLSNSDHLQWMKESTCAILIYDVSSSSSFDLVTQESFGLAKTLLHDTKSFMLLVGNKLDLDEENPNARQVSFDEASDFA